MIKKKYSTLLCFLFFSMLRVNLHAETHSVTIPLSIPEEEISYPAPINTSFFSKKPLLNPSSFNDLPCDLVKHIGSFLPIRTAEIYAQVNHRTHRLFPSILLGMCRSTIFIDWADQQDRKAFSRIWKSAVKMAKEHHILLSLSIDNLSSYNYEESDSLLYRFDLGRFEKHNKEHFWSFNPAQYSFQYLKRLHLRSVVSENLLQILRLNLPNLQELEYSLKRPKAGPTKKPLQLSIYSRSLARKDILLNTFKTLVIKNK